MQIQKQNNSRRLRNLKKVSNAELADMCGVAKASLATATQEMDTLKDEVLSRNSALDIDEFEGDFFRVLITHVEKVFLSRELVRRAVIRAKLATRKTAETWLLKHSSKTEYDRVGVYLRSGRRRQKRAA